MSLWRLTWGGAIYGDTWQNTVHLNMGADATPGTSVQIMSDFAADVKKWFAAMTFISAANLSWLKFNQIDPATGRYTSQTDTNELTWTPVYGGATSVQVPPQVSLCVSLHTAVKRGPAARGRIFTVPPNIQLDSNGHLAAAARTTYGNACATLIRDLNNAPGIDGTTSNPQVVVLGKGGQTRPVTAVSIGSVVDTQRRRRSALKEVYTTVNI